MTNMPRLSRDTHCTLCASPEHKAADCPRRELSAKPKSDAAIARAAAKRAAAVAKRAAAVAKLAAAVAKRDAAKTRAAAKRAADRAIIVATKARQANEDAYHNAVYLALNALQPVPATAGNYQYSRWAVVVDVCGRCGRPSLGCMCT